MNEPINPPPFDRCKDCGRIAPLWVGIEDWHAMADDAATHVEREQGLLPPEKPQDLLLQFLPDLAGWKAYGQEGDIEYVLCPEHAT